MAEYVLYVGSWEDEGVEEELLIGGDNCVCDTLCLAAVPTNRLVFMEVLPAFASAVMAADSVSLVFVGFEFAAVTEEVPRFLRGFRW